MPITTINEISVRSKIISASKQRQFVGLARSAANTRFIFAKQKMLKDFDEHEVTKELNKNNYAVEGSELVDHGNLLSFIGFPEGSDPAGELRDYLASEENTYMAENANITDNGRNRIYYEFKVYSPSMNQINNEEQFETPDNWRSTSWIAIIENGVSNAVYYVFAKSEDTADKFREAGSRSGYGLQRKDKKSGAQQPREAGGSFTPVKYVSEILQNFIDRFK